MKLLRKILFPFSLLYGGITANRNLFYDKGWLRSQSYGFPIICVGNLSTGGTGKSPMIEVLISILKDDHRVAVLSRGYKRATKGFFEVSINSTVIEVGDEPLQFKTKFPDISVAVCEDRQTGIQELRTEADIILLDDAFQHRKVNATFNILLTPYNDLYVDDFMLPTGNLREPRSGAKRADLIVVTKCPENLNASEMVKIEKKLSPKPNQKVFFTKIEYSPEIKNASEEKPLAYLKDKEFTLITGIANPEPLVQYLEHGGLDFHHKEFPDHHNFSVSEIKELEQDKLLLTTEKDYMRLKDELSTEMYYLPIRTAFLNEGEALFKEKIKEIASS